MECQKCAGKAQTYLCGNCAVWLRKQLLGLPTIIGHLNDAALGLTRMSTEQSRQLGFASRTPVFSDKASQLVAAIESTIGQWAKEIAVTHGYVISAPVNLSPLGYTYTSTDYATFLAAHVNELARDEDVGELCASLRSYVNRAVGGRDEGGLLNRPIPDQFCGPCPAIVSDHRRCVDEDGINVCGNRPHECATRLMSRRGAVEVTCRFCGAVHDVQRLVNHLLARADNFRCVISEMYVVLRMLGEPVPMSTLYRWAEPKSPRRGSGQLAPAGYLRPDNQRIGVSRNSDKDTPLYRVSDARKINTDRKVKGKTNA